MITLLNQTGQIWAPIFGAAVIQNTIFIGLVYLALYLLRNATARVRYAVALAGLVKLLLPPLFALPILPGAPITSLPLTAFASAGIGTTITQSFTNAPTVFTLVGLLFSVWTAGIIAILTACLISALRLRRLLRDAKYLVPDDECAALPGKRIDLLKSDRIPVPLTIGCFRPRIFVPASWDSWPPACRRMVLTHELAHIRRCDNWIAYLQTVARAIYLFHPLVWKLNRTLAEIREMACDDVITENKKEFSIEYARYLVRIAEELNNTPQCCFSASALIRRKNELLNRVRYQMEGRMKTLTKTHLVLLFVGLAALAGLLSWTCAEKEPAPTESASTLETAQVAPKTGAVPLEMDGEIPAFIPFDEPPAPVVGYKSIQENLVYPELARKAGVEGRVMLWVKIGEDGNVLATKIMKSLGPNGCDEAAMEAIKKTKWNPAEKDGTPIPVWVAVPVDFRLAE